MLKSTTRPLSEAYQLALLDLDGVVYRGKNPVEHAAESIRKAEGLGMTVEYTTNNSSRLQSVVADQLKGFDLDVEPWQVITSSVVAARMVARAVPQGAKVFVLGAQHLREEVAKQGLEVVDSAEDKPVAAIQGWYPDMSWNQMAQIAYAVEQCATYFVTNRDLTIPPELVWNRFRPQASRNPPCMTKPDCLPRMMVPNQWPRKHASPSVTVSIPISKPAIVAAMIPWPC